MIEKILNEFVEKCKKKFGKNLVSIVLFGSYARGKARETSDIDVLVIAKKLPSNVWERDKIIEEIVLEFLFKYGKRFSPILVTENEIRKHAKWPNPLFYGILLGYKSLYGKEFFEEVMNIVKNVIKEKKPIFVEGGKEWDLEKLI